MTPSCAAACHATERFLKHNIVARLEKSAHGQHRAKLPCCTGVGSQHKQGRRRQEIKLFGKRSCAVEFTACALSMSGASGGGFSRYAPRCAGDISLVALKKRSRKEPSSAHTSVSEQCRSSRLAPGSSTTPPHEQTRPGIAHTNAPSLLLLSTTSASEPHRMQHHCGCCRPREAGQWCRMRCR